MEFKTQNRDCGQIRIYILPDDVGRATISRQRTALRRSMKLLLAQLDIRNDTWNGSWDSNSPMVHVDSSLDDDNLQDDPSLFQLFNSLPSPNPDPDVVSDIYARRAIHDILNNNVYGLSTAMYKYQCRSAALMLQREAQPSQMIDPRLIHLKDQRGTTWYCDLSASSCLIDPRTYETAKGGICAETMGLGKTLICLSLILATRDLSSHVPVEYSVGTTPVRKTTGSLMEMCACTIGRSGTPWKNYFAPQDAEELDLTRCKEALRDGVGYYHLPGARLKKSFRNAVLAPPRKIWLSTATIVVVPSNLIQQWQKEIKKHVLDGALSVLVMQSPKDILPPARVIADYDIILFTKERFKQESRDGLDEQGRHAGTSTKVCNCTYINATRDRACTCFRDDAVYRSPLRDLHFKRLITDEGHTFGNTSTKKRTDALTVVDGLRLDARWIVSGTPTQGLYGAEINRAQSHSALNTPVMENSPIHEDPDRHKHISKSAKEMDALFNRQERKDLEKLGNIATSYLKARPWANRPEDEEDTARWEQHVMQPRHGSKSHGSLDCLRATLESMIIRHRPEDVYKDVALPPLYVEAVHLDGSVQDIMSLNTFSMMIIGNAVTSERKDADYLFHPGAVKELQRLVSNLRQASFFWSGFSHSDIVSSINTSQGFLDADKVAVSSSDKKLLEASIIVGTTILKNRISETSSIFHEMPMYLENHFPKRMKAIWALNGKADNPTLIGATSLLAIQKFTSTYRYKKGASLADGLAEKGYSNRDRMRMEAHPPKANTSRDTATAPLAGSVTAGSDSAKKLRNSPKTPKTVTQTIEAAFTKEPLEKMAKTGPNSTLFLPQDQSKIAKQIRKPAKLVSTASAKLSYLMHKIVLHDQADEKVLVFYESNNVAYYIGEALELLGIKHLFFSKTLKTKQRADHIVLFNADSEYRVLIMDVSQAAFGLDLSSASRVYFVNPILNPLIEAQAIKRAHRIGQTKPVYVETLVLKGSIEELILSRRNTMSAEEHKKCKSILDDEIIYDWIRNARFLDLPTGDIPGPDQMASLKVPQPLFIKSGPELTHEMELDDEAYWNLVRRIKVVVSHVAASARGSARGHGDPRKLRCLMQIDGTAMPSKHEEEYLSDDDSWEIYN